jgi:hypothetical protein
MQYILLAKSTVQVSEDRWERKTFTKIIDESMTAKEMFEWIEREGHDKDTIQLLPNS